MGPMAQFLSKIVQLAGIEGTIGALGGLVVGAIVAGPLGLDSEGAASFGVVGCIVGLVVKFERS